MLGRYCKVPAGEHQLISTRIEVAESAKADAEAKTASSANEETRPADLACGTIEEEEARSRATDPLLADSMIQTARPKNVPNAFRDVIESRPNATVVVPTKSPKITREPEAVIAPEVVSDPEKLIKHESAGVYAPKVSSLPKQPEDSEGPESEDDETDIDLSDDDGEFLDEFKDKVNAVLQGFGTPYDPSNEATPMLPAYHPSFIKAEKLCVQLLDDLAQMLKSTDYKDAKLIDLYEQAMIKQTITYPKPRRIGVVGDSGVGSDFGSLRIVALTKGLIGKSSLINSLLDTPELALQVGKCVLSTNLD